MAQRYYYHEHQSDYAVVKAKGLMLRAALYGHPDFEAFSSRSYLEEMLPRLGVAPDARVLELGCGTGPGACFLAKRGYRVDGIDLIPDAVDRARENAEGLGLDIRYEAMDVCDLPVQGEAYDLIVDSYCTQGIVMDQDRDRMFWAIKGRLSERGYLLLSCCVLEESRLDRDVTVRDQATGKTYIRFDTTDLFDQETETCYNKWRPREGLPDAAPEDYDGTVRINGEWYIHRRRYRTPANLRKELERHGFEVLEQSGEVMENAVCVHEGVGVRIAVG